MMTLLERMYLDYPLQVLVLAFLTCFAVLRWIFGELSK
jgi:hypothetical protein